MQAAHDRAQIPLTIGEDQVNAWDSTGAALRYIVTLPTKLVLSPIIDGLGKAAWRNMLRRTQMLFHREDEFDIRDRRDPAAVREHLRQGPQGAAHQLFSRLDAYLRAHPDVELTLIGHSMGTIVLNRALRLFPALPVRHIVYMAAACSIDDFQTSVVPHLDNFLGDPTTTLDRTLGSWENIMQAAHVVPMSVRAHVTLKAFGIGGPPRPDGLATPTTHGAFTDRATRFWCPQVWSVAGDPPPDRCAATMR